MAEKDRSVTELDSDTNENKDGSTPAGGEKGREGTEDQGIKSLREENKKKDAELKELKSAVSKLTDKIKELETAPNKTKAEKEEIQDLKKLKEEAKKAILEHGDFPAWKEIMQEIASEISEKLYLKNDQIYALELAQEIAERDGYETENFFKEVNVILGNRWMDKLPQQRLKLAVKEWKKHKDTEERLKKAEETEKKLKDKESQFVESGGTRVPRKPSISQDIESAKKGGNWEDVIRRVLPDQPTVAKK